MAPHVVRRFSFSCCDTFSVDNFLPEQLYVQPMIQWIKERVVSAGRTVVGVRVILSWSPESETIVMYDTGLVKVTDGWDERVVVKATSIIGSHPLIDCSVMFSLTYDEGCIHVVGGWA